MFKNQDIELYVCKPKNQDYFKKCPSLDILMSPKYL